MILRKRPCRDIETYVCKKITVTFTKRERAKRAIRARSCFTCSFPKIITTLDKQSNAYRTKPINKKLGQRYVIRTTESQARERVRRAAGSTTSARAKQTRRGLTCSHETHRGNLKVPAAIYKAIKISFSCSQLLVNGFPIDPERSARKRVEPSSHEEFPSTTRNQTHQSVAQSKGQIDQRPPCRIYTRAWVSLLHSYVREINGSSSEMILVGFVAKMLFLNIFLNGILLVIIFSVDYFY